MSALTKDIAFSETKFSLQWKHIFDAGWNAATIAAEEKFTAERTLGGVAPTTEQSMPCLHLHVFQNEFDRTECGDCGNELSI